MRVSIHQPQYIPWLGYFFKILHSDCFVLFDSVQYPRGKHFGNRNEIKTAQGAQWLTVPVQGRGDLLPYRELPIDNAQDWAKKHWRTLEHAYTKAPYWELYRADLHALYLEQMWHNIAELNQALLQFCFNALHLDTKIVCASALDVERTGISTDEYIFALLKRVGADSYISGQGAGSQRYIEPQAFAAQGIELWFYEFTAPHYAQLWGDFVPNLSVLDVLFQCGENSRELLEQGGRLIRA